MPPSSSNKYLKLLDDGLSIWMYARNELNQPFLPDNPLLVGPWHDDFDDYLQSTEPMLYSLICTGLLLDSKGGIIFSTLEHRL